MTSQNQIFSTTQNFVQRGRVFSWASVARHASLFPSPITKHLLFDGIYFAVTVGVTFCVLRIAWLHPRAMKVWSDRLAVDIMAAEAIRGRLVSKADRDPVQPDLVVDPDQFYQMKD